MIALRTFVVYSVYMTTLLFVAFTSSPFMGDEIVMKKGETHFGTIIEDLGDAYRVETENGLRLTLKKSDIEKVVPVAKSAGPLSGATFTRLEGKTKRTVCLAAVAERPMKDLLVAGAGAEARIQGAKLVLDFKSDDPSRLLIPAKPGEEYDLVLTVERKDGVGDFFLGLQAGGRQVVVQLDADQGARSGVEGLEKSECGKLLEKNEPVKVVCQLRKDGLLVMTERLKDKRKETVVNWKAGLAQLPEASQKHQIPKDKPYIFIGSQKVFGTSANLWHVSDAILTARE